MMKIGLLEKLLLIRVYKLDRLVDDYSWIVRLAVAEQGYGLDRLVNDSNYQVHIAAAKGYDLDKLI